MRLDDKEYIINGKRFFGKKSRLPFENGSLFTIGRKFICPKQVNDTVRIFFTGDFKIKEVRAGEMLLAPENDGNGNVTYNVTPALKTGKTYIQAVFCEGRVDGFYFDVKRTLE